MSLVYLNHRKNSDFQALNIVKSHTKTLPYYINRRFINRINSVIRYI